MSAFERVVEEARARAGADFAFVLTRKGRLCTRAAPRDMPEIGRTRLARAARDVSGSDRVAEVVMPREELVPYGGAAPIDVYLGVADEQAILCVVMATWADKASAMPAVIAGLRGLEPLLRKGLPRARASRASEAAVTRGASPVPPPPAVAPAAPPSDPGRRSSVPEIRVRETYMGRETMVAIEIEAKARDSSPEIHIGEASLGRETMVAIDLDVGRQASLPPPPRQIAPSSPEDVRVELASAPEIEVEELSSAHDPRATVPWVEAPADAKRAVDAARLGRKVAAPKVSVRLETVEAAALAEADAPASERRRKKSGP